MRRRKPLIPEDIAEAINELLPTEEVDLQKRLVDRLRRNGLMRSMGHDPLAPNCHWHDPEALHAPKHVCETCRKIEARFFGGGRIFGDHADRSGQ